MWKTNSSNSRVIWISQMIFVYVHVLLAGAEITEFSWCSAYPRAYRLTCVSWLVVHRIASGLDLTKTVDFRGKLRSHEEFELLSLTAVLISSWSVIIVPVLLWSWSSVCFTSHMGHILFSFLVWWRRCCPRKWGLLVGREKPDHLLSHKTLEICWLPVLSIFVWCGLQRNQSYPCPWTHWLDWAP